MEIRMWGLMGCLLLGGGVWANGLNKDFGLEVWSDNNLWDDKAEVLAERLGLSGSGKGVTGYYQGALRPGTKVLEGQAFMIHLYATGSKVQRVVIGFASRADIQRILSTDPKQQGKTEGELAMLMEKEFQAMVTKDVPLIREALSKRLGKPAVEEGKEEWTWSGHKLVLNPSGDNVTLAIEPAALGNELTGRAAERQKQYDTAKLISELPRRADRRSNGDVVLEGVPAVSQGARNYCVPASWEKCLLYYGLKDLDVYALAQTGGTTVNGTMFMPFTAKVNPVLEERGFLAQLVKEPAQQVSAVKSYIDRGVPLLWALNAAQLPEWVARSANRTGRLKEIKPVRGAKEPPDAPHALMIIGYNSGFNELCLSDSTELGASSPEIWIMAKEAEQMGYRETEMVAVVPKALGSDGGGAARTPGAGTPVPYSGKKWY
ncbi:MAG: hypothetical protein HC901_00980 [Bdellovibrionaceae bacterium]|nr:hypothetical protein [Pseudobdellovibrionaceae bacterium]